MNVKLISVTQPIHTTGGPQTAEELMVHCARVSNPSNQANHETGPRLLNYCIKAGHWSVFEMAHLTLEITTSRAISAQILRHKSMSAQEFSQRYAEVQAFETSEPRRQDVKNRQNSLDDLPEETKAWWRGVEQAVQIDAWHYYQEALEKGIAKECARFLLPMSSQTTLYLCGNVRSWIHWFQVRRAPSTQKEHRDIADAAWEIFKGQFPHTAEALAQNKFTVATKEQHK